MTTSATRLFPRATERSYLAQIRKRLRLMRILLEEEMDRDTDPRRVVDRVRQVLTQIPVALEPLKRQANAAARFSSNVVDRETTKVLPQLAPAHASAEVRSAVHAAALLTLQDLTRRRDAIQAKVVQNVPVTAGQLDQWAKDNSRLISGLQQTTLDKIADEVTAAVREGATGRQLREVLTKQLGIADNRAKTIARDQVGTLNAQVTQQRQQQLGVEWYEWSSSEDERVRPLHEDLDGTIRRWDDPHPTEGHPGHAINCRCVALPVFPDEVVAPSAPPPAPPPPEPRVFTTEEVRQLSDLIRLIEAQPRDEDRIGRAQDLFFEVEGSPSERITAVRDRLLGEGATEQQADLAIGHTLALRNMNLETLGERLSRLPTLEGLGEAPPLSPAEAVLTQHRLLTGHLKAVQEQADPELADALDRVLTNTRVREAGEIEAQFAPPLSPPEKGQPLPDATAEAFRPVMQELLFAYEDTPQLETKEALREVMLHFGAEEIGSVGEVQPVDAMRHQTRGLPLSPGDDVEITRPAVQFAAETLVKAEILPVEPPPPSPPPVDPDVDWDGDFELVGELEPVRAKAMTEAFTVETNKGPVEGQVGDVLVEGPRGRFVLDPDMFEAVASRVAPAPPEPAKPPPEPVGTFTERVTSLVARTPPTPPFTDQVAISELYDAYRAEHGDVESLDEFKDRLVGVAREREVRLTPIELPELMDDEVRTRSTTAWNRKLVHFVRKPKTP